MEKLLMSSKERKRLEVFSRVKNETMTLVEASEVLRLSYRQTKRSWSRYQEEGDRGLVHRARGKPSNRQAEQETKERALSLYREQYSDYGPTLAAECLSKEDGIEVKVTTLRRWLVAAGLWERKRKRRKHRLRRARRSHFGELVQLDGSHHDWFEGRRLVGQPASRREIPYAGWAVLMVMIDDATGRVFARFYENESWHSAADVFTEYVARYGLPRGLYVDQAAIYRADREPTSEEILADKQPETQYGRAMRELDVELILARSAQAKGRVERMNGTLQDRLVKAMRRAKVSDLGAANKFLDEVFLPELNARFTVTSAKSEDWHRGLDASLELSCVLSVQETRVVQNDWTIRWHNRLLQLPVESASVVEPSQSVTLCEQLDGALRVFLGDVELSWSEASRDPSRSKPKPKPHRDGPTGSSQGHKPRADHPWRKPFKEPTHAS
jgi:transposase